MIIDEDVYLEHHGILGQRWGVRRREFELAKANFNRQDARTNGRKDNQLTENKAGQKLGTKGFTVKKGSLISRTTTAPEFDLDGNPLFVSTNPQDALNYRAVAPTWSNKTGRVEKKLTGPAYYESTFHATNDLKSPSEKTRIEAYISLMDKKAIKLKDGRTIDGRTYLKEHGLEEAVKKLSSRELALQYYGQFTLQLGIRNEPMNTAYFNEISRRGYNALIDDNDAGRIAKTPLVLLRPSRDLQKISVKKLSLHDVHTAQANLKLP